MSRPLPEVLDRLADRGADALEAGRRPRHRRDALAAALPWLAVGPALVLVLQGLRFAASNGPLPLGPFGLAACYASPFLLAWLWNLTAGRPPRPGRKSGLLAADRALAADDRLIAADEFLRRSERSPFEQAAVDDAARFVADRAGSPLALPAARPAPVAARLSAWGTGAAAALALGVFLNGLDVPRPARPAIGPSVEVAAAPGGEGRPPRDESEGRPPPAPDEGPAATARRERAAAERAAADETARTEAGESTTRAKESRGRTGAGRSAPARTRTGPSDSRGVPTSQAQTSKEPPERPGDDARRPPEERPPDDRERPARKAPPEESGATAGRGAARGSNRNPASTDWSSRDQVTTPDDEELADDEDVEDEVEENEARGGVQPRLRDRRPPVSRDLQIGFGNQQSQDANGRGGPSQQKKSRGTASLVLGVPIPDRVKGQPNPGRTKVTQERVEPRREQASESDAEARAARSGPIGPVARPALPPWLRRLLKDYTEQLRAAEGGEP